MVPPRTAAGELPRLFELDPLRFQGLCRDLYQSEPEIATAEVFGTPGQFQRGADIVATRRDGLGIDVGQCKRVKPGAFNAGVLEDASNELFRNFEYWRERGICKFILFVASDASQTQVQEEHLRQRDRFRHSGVEFELWGAGVITNKLRAQPGIVRTYLDEQWTAILCGVGITGFPQSGLAYSILESQLETLAAHLAEAAEKEVAELRGEWWRGRRTKAIAGLNRLHEGGGGSSSRLPSKARYSGLKQFWRWQVATSKKQSR